ncbi:MULTISPECIES: 2OG-Fe(II) oxygenase [Rhodomicrobium]|uniref:2OG-Fe(II) oxygenase n=1 Tax=Rhodomicrobium TaxID=1068 RepID=UPI000B4A7407|nr:MULTISPECIES: 2OG-Fe(II) oxygenase [Rhodomicrobium]
MTVTQELAEILADVERPGDYYVAGRAEFLAPLIDVDGVGVIALPLLPAQAKQLIKAATRAPFGRGSETVVDTKIRRTWQIEASRVAIGGKHWLQTINGIVARAAEGLGVAGPVTAELYKLLVYDKGSFFVSHRDTEKAPGMFATLVVALPSQSEGGELIVQHKDRKARLDLHTGEPSEIAFAAFYADCTHEVLPVTTGCRATLVFNLVREGKGRAPEPPSYEAETERVASLLGAWAQTKDEADNRDHIGNAADDVASPEKIVYLLEHAYTPAELAFETLKGADAAIARLLTAAAPRAACDLHLALLTVWESGSAEYTGRENWHYRRGRRDAGEEEHSAEFEVIEVLDDARSLSEWRRPDGAPTALGTLPIVDEEVSPTTALDNMEPDEEHFREATGNEGASFDRTYARAALVIWPSSRILAVLNQAGLEATLPYLEGLLDKWQVAGPKKGLEHKQQALELAGHMIAAWPEHSWYGRESAEPSYLGRMLSLLARLGDLAPVEAILDKLVSRQGHDKADNAAILEVVALFPHDRAAETLRKIVAAHAVDALGSCGALLAGALNGAFANKPALLFGVARALVDYLPGDPASAPKDQWGRSRGVKPDATFVGDLVGVVDRVDVGLAKHAAAHILAWPQHFGLDRVLVPAATRLLQERRHGGAAFDALRNACVTHLETRIAEPLEAPRNWTRPSAIGCECQHCSALSGFLADAGRENWTLRAAQQIRTHVENEIRRASADVDTETLRKGSPHSLICTKNQASYNRRVTQRKQDLADITVIHHGLSSIGSE